MLTSCNFLLHFIVMIMDLCNENLIGIRSFQDGLLANYSLQVGKFYDI